MHDECAQNPLKTHVRTYSACRSFRWSFGHLYVRTYKITAIHSARVFFAQTQNRKLTRTSESESLLHSISLQRAYPSGSTMAHPRETIESCRSFTEASDVSVQALALFSTWEWSITRSGINRNNNNTLYGRPLAPLEVNTHQVSFRRYQDIVRLPVDDRLFALNLSGPIAILLCSESKRDGLKATVTSDFERLFKVVCRGKRWKDDRNSASALTAILTSIKTILRDGQHQDGRSPYRLLFRILYCAACNQADESLITIEFEFDHEALLSDLLRDVLKVTHESNLDTLDDSWFDTVMPQYSGNYTHEEWLNIEQSANFLGCIILLKHLCPVRPSLMDGNCRVVTSAMALLGLEYVPNESTNGLKLAPWNACREFAGMKSRVCLWITKPLGNREMKSAVLNAKQFSTRLEKASRLTQSHHNQYFGMYNLLFDYCGFTSIIHT